MKVPLKTNLDVAATNSECGSFCEFNFTPIALSIFKSFKHEKYKIEVKIYKESASIA